MSTLLWCVIIQPDLLSVLTPLFLQTKFESVDRCGGRDFQQRENSKGCQVEYKPDRQGLLMWRTSVRGEGLT